MIKHLIVHLFLLQSALYTIENFNIKDINAANQQQFNSNISIYSSTYSYAVVITLSKSVHILKTKINISLIYYSLLLRRME